MTTTPAKWTGSKKFKPEQVKEAVSSMPAAEQQRRALPVLARMVANVGRRVAHELGQPGADLIREAARRLGPGVGADLAPEKIDLTKAGYKELLRAVAGTDDLPALAPERLQATFHTIGMLLMGLSCEVLAKYGDERGQHLVEQAWEEVARERMYWDTVADQFEVVEMDAKTAIGMLAGTDAFFGVQFDVGRMTPGYAERNITFCTPVALALRLGYPHETVRKFGEIVATSVCIRGVESMLPGLKVKYLTRIHYGDPSCEEVAEYDPKAAKAEVMPSGPSEFVLERYHHRVFGAVASMKSEFIRPEWQRVQQMRIYLETPAARKQQLMAEALGAQPAAADLKESRADNSKTLQRVDALRFLAARTARAGGDEQKAFREMIYFWANDFDQAVVSMDFPDAWKDKKAGRLFQEIASVSAAMLKFDKPNRDYPNATWDNAMRLYNFVYEMHLALDDLLFETIGGAARPVLTPPPASSPLPSQGRGRGSGQARTARKTPAAKQATSARKATTARKGASPKPAPTQGRGRGSGPKKG